MREKEDIIVIGDRYAIGARHENIEYYFGDISIPPAPETGKWILILYPDGPRWLELEEES